ncbi:MAG: hypothetical protein MJ182_01455 [Treponema sp.]|nr:hypothetical protein [Treponema sp.]
MKLIEKNFLKTLLFSFCLLGQISVPWGNQVYAATKKKKTSKADQVENSVKTTSSETNKESDNNSDTNPNGIEASATKISVPTKKKNTYFTKIDDNIVLGIEKGSPLSVSQSLLALRKPLEEYKDNEKVLIAVGMAIMDIVWPSEHFSFEVPPVDFQTPYTGAINFVKRGFFDSSTGNVDFLSSVLPALVLVSDETLSDSVLEQCNQALVKASEFSENSVLLDYLWGCFYQHKSDFLKAKGYFEKLYVTNSSVYEIAFRYSDVQYALKEYESANRIASVLLEKNPANLELLKLSARISFESGDFDMAEAYVGRGLQQMPNNLEFLLFRAKILMEKKDYIHAVSLLDMYARQNDTNAEYLILRTRLQLEWSNNVTLATETVEKTLALYPEKKEGLLLAARIASITNSPVAGKYADELVSRILEADPDNTEALVYSLNALERRSLWQSAYEISHRLALEGKLSSDIVAKHVEICLQLGKTGEASSIAQKAYDQDPQNETVVMAYVLAQIAGGNKKQSLELIDSLLETSSQKIMRSNLYYRRSFLQGTESAAMADLRRSLTENARNTDSLFRLYEIYYEKEDFKKAQYYLKQVVALNPNDSNYRKMNESLTQLLK